MDGHYRKSRAWSFIAIAFVLLALFIINGLVLVDQSDAKSVPGTPPNTIISFLLACAALLFAIAANASAYLNPRSTMAMKIASPVTFLLVAVLVIPFFISLGVMMIS